MVLEHISLREVKIFWDDNLIEKNCIRIFDNHYQQIFKEHSNNFLIWIDMRLIKTLILIKAIISNSLE